EHTSPWVHASPSSQAAVLGAKVQLPSPLQLSVVHGLESSQVYGVPAQAPETQWSPCVHGSPSLHALPSDPAPSQPSGCGTPVPNTEKCSVVDSTWSPSRTVVVSAS